MGNATALRAPRKTGATTNVVQLRVVSDTAKGRKEALVSLFQALADRAAAGEITGISYALVRSDGEFYLGNCGDPRKHPSTGAAMASALWYQEMKLMFGEED